MKKYFQKNKGFTIIETMIAVSLFLVVVTLGLGTLLNANLLHKKSDNMRSIMDGLSFVVDDISTNLRTGYHYHCFVTGDIIPAVSSPTVSTPKSCASGWGIAFEPANGVQSNNDDQWVYYINAGKMFKATQGPYSATNFVQMTPNEVVIDSNSSFAVLGADPPSAASNDKNQPLVFIRIIGKIVTNNVTTPFSLQTSVSQRLLDI